MVVHQLLVHEKVLLGIPMVGDSVGIAIKFGNIQKEASHEIHDLKGLGHEIRIGLKWYSLIGLG